MTYSYYANPMGSDDPQDPLPPIGPGICPDEGAEKSPEEQHPDDWGPPPSKQGKRDPLSAPN